MEDVSVLDVDGTSYLGLFRNGSLEITADEIDVTAARDSWKKREFGTMDWQLRLTTLVSASPSLVSSLISGGTIVVSCVTTGFNFLGTAMLTAAPLALDNPVTCEVTALSAGTAPTISFA